jgi:hypothetical protein
MNKDSAVYGLRCFMSQPITALVIMGVAGCGKSSVSQALCLLNGATPIEGDSFHPAANIAKMSAGIPLTDDDRAGWLDSLCDELRRAVKSRQRPVLTCSALKLRYREHLRSSPRRSGLCVPGADPRSSGSPSGPSPRAFHAQDPDRQPVRCP